MTKIAAKTHAAIAIPADKRGAVRSYLKGRPGWEAFCAREDIVSREAKNADLIRFAVDQGYEAEVKAIIFGGKPSDYLPVHPDKCVNALSDANFKANVEIVTEDEMTKLENDAANNAVHWGEDPVAAVETVRQAHAVELFDAPSVSMAGDVAFVPVEVAASDVEAFHAAWNEKRDEEVEALIATSDVLASVDQFLSPFVRAQIEAALRPILEKANRVPETVVREVVVEKEVIRTVAAPLVAPQGSLPFATKGNAVALGKLFGFTGAHAKKMVHLWESHGAAPAIDPYYVVDPFNMAMMATALDRGENVWLVGPGGSGKTSMPAQFCAYTNRPFVKISFTRNSHVDDMVGGQGVKNGNSGWEDGVLIEAMKRPGTVILLDEISLAPAGVQGLYQGAADEHRTYTLPTGEKVVAAPGVCFVVADNTNGNGDDTGLYQGTNQCNGALVNRFARMIRVEYMSVEVEANALHQHCPKAPLAACTHMAEFVARARKLPSMENAILSLRNMVAFTRVVLDGFTPKEAATVTILNQMVSQDRAALETLFTLAWEKDFATLISGGEVAAPATVTLQGFGADHGAFDDEVTAVLNR